MSCAVKHTGIESSVGRRRPVHGVLTFGEGTAAKLVTFCGTLPEGAVLAEVGYWARVTCATCKRRMMARPQLHALDLEARRQREKGGA